MIEIKDADKFKELAEKYKIKYMQTPEGEFYELNQEDNTNGIDIDKEMDVYMLMCQED